MPNGVDELLFADDALPVADQVVEQVKYLWSDSNQIGPAMQLAPVSVERVLFEETEQAASPLGGPPIAGRRLPPLRPRRISCW